MIPLFWKMTQLQTSFQMLDHSYSGMSYLEWWTLEALILHSLTPKGAEILTRKFEEMDQQINKEEQSEFYRLFYGVFDDQFAAMNAILDGKESFAFQAFKSVLDKYLGVHLDRSNS
ncbi:F-box protein [Canna indica]|uniref:F-box protein n=1 Tax=Canna indica TaxID=4628 RepID=A0AAQ3JLB9_9LILI|nr:F-box protein [Canna indica]